MSQKQRLILASQLAMRVKSIASSLRYDAESYDVKFPVAYADKLERLADEFLKSK